MDQFQRNPAPYARILGFRKESSSLLRQINDKGSIPLITKPASILKAVDAKDQWMWEKDLAASRLYQSISFQEFGRKLTGAYERSPVIY